MLFAELAINGGLTGPDVFAGRMGIVLIYKSSLRCPTWRRAR
jgi:hypothetical protein